MNILSETKNHFIDLYSFERLNDFNKIATFENIPEEEVRKTYKTLSHYFAAKLDVPLETIKRLFDDTKPEQDYINSIYRKCTEEREKGFHGFKNFFKWYDSQDKQCGYCETTQSTLQEIFQRGLIYSKKFSATLHIERLNSEDTYHEKNCILACSLCNNAKSDLISESDYIQYFKGPMKKYLYDKVNSNIIDNETNFLYFSSQLKEKHPTFYESFTSILKSNNIQYDELDNTNDIWCRDYMPIQISSNHFTQYIYEPDYLKNEKYKHLMTTPTNITNSLKINVKTLDLVLDGGNIIRSKNTVILTDKIFSENPHFSKEEVLKKLKSTLNLEKVVVIPKQPYDPYGHTDGMVRFINEDTLLINDFSRESDSFQRALFTALDSAKLQYKTIKYSNEYLSKKANWGGYINYLRMKDFILLPTFNIKEDKNVIKQFKEVFPSCKIATVPSDEIMKEGGVLNCITWNIYHNHLK